MLLPNSKPPGNFGRPRSPTAKELALKKVLLRNALNRSQGIAAQPAVGKITAVTEPPMKSTSTACALISQYRELNKPREIAEFGKKNRTVLANSDLHELIKCRIFAGKPLTGFCLTLLSTRTEQQP